MATSNGLPGFVTVYKAAEMIGVSHAQVTRYIANDQLDATLVGREYLIREKDVRSFVRPPRGNPLFNKSPRKTAT